MRKNIFALKTAIKFFVMSLFSTASAAEKLAPAGSTQGAKIFAQMGNRGNVGSIVFSQDLF